MRFLNGIHTICKFATHFQFYWWQSLRRNLAPMSSSFSASPIASLLNMSPHFCHLKLSFFRMRCLDLYFIHFQWQVHPTANYFWYQIFIRLCRSICLARFLLVLCHDLQLSACSACSLCWYVIASGAVNLIGMTHTHTHTHLNVNCIQQRFAHFIFGWND